MIFAPTPTGVSMRANKKPRHPVRLSMRRRDFLKRGAALASAVVLPSAVDLKASAATAGSTLVIAAPATPQSLDCNFDGSLGTIDAVAALYDALLDFKKIPDPRLPGVLREDIADYPNLPAGLNVEGKLAQSFELDPAAKFIRFQLRQGVKSNWGNELTADDVKWTWDRKFGTRCHRRLLCLYAWSGEQG